MKSHKRIPAKVSVLTWLISTALFAGSAPGQFRYPSPWLVPQEDNVTRKARKIDQYENIRFNDEKARLDAFAIELQQDPTDRGLIIGYGGSICSLGEAIARANRAKDYLRYTRGIDVERLITRNGGYRSQVGAELYVVPLGASVPKAQPTIPRCTKSGSISKTPPRRNSR